MPEIQINQTYFHLNNGQIEKVICEKQKTFQTTKTTEKGKVTTTKPSFHFRVLESTKKTMSAFETYDLRHFYNTFDEAKQVLVSAFESRLEEVKNLTENNLKTK